MIRGSHASRRRMAPHGCLKVAGEAIGSEHDRITQSDRRTLMVNLGLFLLALGVLMISLESAGAALVFFTIAFTLIKCA